MPESEDKSVLSIIRTTCCSACFRNNFYIYCKTEIIKAVFILYLVILMFGVISAATLLYLLQKFAAKLPEEWKNSKTIRNFRLGIFFLMIYLLLVLVGEFICIQLFLHRIYNSYVISLNTSLFTTFLYGFLFLHTETTWKKYTYFFLYAVVLSYFIFGGYYHPRSVLGGTAILFIYIPFFLAASIHLTDLLIQPKNSYFRFRLRLSLNMLFYSLITLIVQSFQWYYEEEYLSTPIIIFYVSISNVALYYSFLALIFSIESIKLYRKRRSVHT